MDEDAFLMRIVEAEVWSLHHRSDSAPNRKLRSTALYPLNRSANANTYGNFDYEWRNQDEAWNAVETIAQERTRLLEARGQSPATDLQISTRGRLIGAEPLLSDWSGISAEYSNGFIDALDVPPWDMWIAFEAARMQSGSPVHSGILLTWVPEDYLSLANTAIQVNPVGCIWWATDTIYEAGASPLLDMLRTVA